MAKGPKKKKARKPRVGDTVYLKGVIPPMGMDLRRIEKRGNIEYGYCVWSTYHLDENKESVSTPHAEEFLLETLTITSPASPTQIFVR